MTNALQWEVVILDKGGDQSCSAKVAHPALGLVLPSAGRGSSWSGVTIGRAQASLASQMGLLRLLSLKNHQIDESLGTILGKNETIDNGIISSQFKMLPVLPPKGIIPT